ncbi:MAG: response regulator transcription factor, partial [Olsenella sp.]
DSIRIDSDELEKLTKREQEIVRLVCMGMSNQQIGDELLISEHTVKLHVSKILRKLNLSNRTQVAVYGMQALQ